MIESPIIAQLLNEKETKTRAEVLLQVLRKRHGRLPRGLATGVRACTDEAALKRWFDLALDAPSLDQFRQQAGL